jgi:hypothetical protein
MKILLDECVPWPIHRELPGYECTTPQRQGWAGTTNGDLIDLAEAEFDLFITADQNIRYQQNLQGRRLPILVVSTNDLRRLREFASAIVEAVNQISPGDYIELQVP